MYFDMEFGALPPEINSARMYDGPGSGPMLTAATAWDQLARELTTSAACYRSVLAGLATDGWRGPSSTLMAGAASRYVDWLHATAGQAEQTAVHVRAATAAYQTAREATVAPQLITANRLRLTALIATNFFGQNSPAIAATETDYERMWAQDAVAMHTYAASASSASTLTPFTSAPTVASPTAATPAAVDPSTLLSTALGIPSLTSAAASTTSSTFSGVAISTTNHALTVNAMRDQHQGIGPFIAGTLRPLAPPRAVGVGVAAVSALTGRASAVGRLSVPQGWAAVEAATTPASAVLASAGNPAPAPTVPSALPPGVFGEAMLGTLAGRGTNTAAAKLRRPGVIPRSPAAG